MSSMNFAFISRHPLTAEQITLAAEQDIVLFPIGDTDAFNVTGSWIVEAGRCRAVEFDGVVVAHPAAALRLCPSFLIGVFENANRAPVGQPPQFSAKALYLFDLRG